MRGMEDYLEEIKRLEEDGDRITATVLARTLEVSLPSASEMLKRLAGEGYLSREDGGTILLTPDGRRLAHTMLRRHRLVECLLVQKLQMAWYEVHGEAHKIEHAISARVEEARRSWRALLFRRSATRRPRIAAIRSRTTAASVWSLSIVTAAWSSSP